MSRLQPTGGRGDQAQAARTSVLVKCFSKLEIMRSPEQMAGHVVVAPRREAAFRAMTRRAVTVLHGGCRMIRRRKMAVVRLGDGSRRPRRFMGALRRLRLRLRWVVAAMYRRALRRLRACYAKAINNVLEGAALVGAVRADAGV